MSGLFQVGNNREWLQKAGSSLGIKKTLFSLKKKKTHTKNQKHFASLIVEAIPVIVKRLGRTGYRDVSCAGRETLSLSCG